MDIKNENPECIVFFRMGDFYETFYEDAKTVAKELEITLTSRGVGEGKAPLAGVPHHSVNPYIAKLIKNGHKVAIVEQVEDPKKAKGLVKRELVRIITPGTVVEPLILEEAKNNYIASILGENEEYAVSFCDISTGEFAVKKIPKKQLIHQLHKLAPAEVIYPLSLEESTLKEELKEFILHPYDDRFFYQEKAHSTLKEHFGVHDLSGFGITSPLLLRSAGALLSYIKETQKNALSHINKLHQSRADRTMHLDYSTIRNLELLKNIMTGKEENTLLSVLDRTTTSMGKRKLRKWVTSPLLQKEDIQERLDAVEELKENTLLRQDIQEHLERVYDLERLIGRVSFGNANPKDLVSLKMSLAQLPKIAQLLAECTTSLLKDIHRLPALEEPKDIIERAIKDEPNTIVTEGNVIRKGYHQELDELRELTHDTKKYLAELEEKEKARTGIKSLKIKYNKVFGYFIEVTKPNLHLVPKEYIRKQTQVNAERFITEELKEKEGKILSAQERIIELESRLFTEVLVKVRKFVPPIQDAGKKVGTLDCLASLSEVAHVRGYCKPLLSQEMEIKESRHPVIEACSPFPFVPNHCSLTGERRTMIITGPNMAGKSTYMRQIALISLMAQMGSFVPAQSAVLPIHDRIFTRVGAYDDLVAGQSTFMVEMTETANILNNATSRSLIILDEIGRGTSTYDGMSLAWAIGEHIHTKIRAKTLFATHYHQLNKLEEHYPGIQNYNVAVEESSEKIIFLRKIVEGGTDKSYGIQVARLAGIPRDVIDASKKVMGSVEQGKVNVEQNKKEDKASLLNYL